VVDISIDAEPGGYAFAMEELAIMQAKTADVEIAAGRHRGLLHVTAY
jgi:hypothetical protein